MIGALGKALTSLGGQAGSLSKMPLEELVAMLARKSAKTGMDAGKMAMQNPGAAGVIGGLGAYAGYQAGQPSPEEEAMVKAYKAGGGGYGL